MVAGFVSFCPCPDVCRKGGKRLGWDDSENNARWRISNHLQSSGYHLLSQDEADSLAASAELQHEDSPENSTGQFEYAPGRSDSSHGKSEGKGTWRSEPYGGKGKGKGHAIQWPERGGKGTGSEMVLQPPEPATAMVARLITAISRAEAAARTSSRMARAAAAAFDEEASHLAQALSELRGDEQLRFN